MAFLSQISTGAGELPVLNFANQQDGCSVFEGTELISCPHIEEDIQICQQKYGKKILLSIGGATYTEGGFSSPAVAIAAADLIWSMFGPQRALQSMTLRLRDVPTLRPFGRAVLDGFDLDFESPIENGVPFAGRLRRLMNQDRVGKYLLTAAPQCVYPDVADNAMLSGNVSFDAVFVQFYNNPCGVQSFHAGVTNQPFFDFSTWDDWARTRSANPHVKVFVGVPASSEAAGSGYVSASALGPVIDYCKHFGSFGGVMMWDASQAHANEGFVEDVKSAVQSVSSRVKQRETVVKSGGIG